VLVAGGLIAPDSTTDATASPSMDVHATTTAEIYDPASGTFGPTGAMLQGMSGQTATCLQDGRVLLAGGYDGGSLLATAELFDPVRGTFASVGPLTTARFDDTATLLQSGLVLVAGGWSDADGTPEATAVLFKPPVYR
jgi:hypothetical protein